MHAADDFAAIAKRLKELEAEKHPKPEPDQVGELSHAYRIENTIMPMAEEDEDYPYIGYGF